MAAGAAAPRHIASNEAVEQAAPLPQQAATEGAAARPSAKRLRLRASHAGQDQSVQIPALSSMVACDGRQGSERVCHAVPHHATTPRDPST